MSINNDELSVCLDLMYYRLIIFILWLTLCSFKRMTGLSEIMLVSNFLNFNLAEYAVFTTWLLSVVVVFNLVYGIRAWVSMWPHVSIGQVPRLFHSTINHLYCQRGWTKHVCCAVGLCESTEGRRVWDFIIIEVLHELLSLLVRFFQLVLQVRNQIFNIFHYCRA